MPTDTSPEIFDHGGMPFRQRVKSRWVELSRSERAVAQHVLITFPKVAFQTVSGVAEVAKTSERSVMRFVQKLGYQGFTELQNELRSHIEGELSSPIDRFWRRREPADDTISEWRHQTIDNITRLERIPNDDLRSAARAVARATGPIYIFGAGKAAAIARYCWYELMLVKPDCRHVDGSDHEVVDQLMDATSDDVLVIFDFRRYLRSSATVTSIAVERRLHIIRVSDSYVSSSGVTSHETLVVSTDSPFLFDGYAAAFGLVDLLVGLTVEDIPKGQVERRLAVYEDLTHKAMVFNPDRPSPRDGNKAAITSSPDVLAPQGGDGV